MSDTIYIYYKRSISGNEAQSKQEKLPLHQKKLHSDKKIQIVATPPDGPTGDIEVSNIMINDGGLNLYLYQDSNVIETISNATIQIPLNYCPNWKKLLCDSRS